MRILITGGARGLGAALANRLAVAHEVTVWDREPLTAEELATARYQCLRRDCAKLTVTQVDVSDDHAVRVAWRDLPEKPHVLVNNAWVNQLTFLDQVDTAVWDLAMSGPLIGAALLTGLMGAYWKAAQDHRVQPRIVNVSSVASRVSMRATAPYCAGKAALDRLTKVAAREFGEFGLSVTGLAPGRIDTGTRMGDQLDAALPTVRGKSPEDMRAYELMTFPLGRRVHLHEVVAAALWLILDAPLACTGTILEVAGAQGA